MTKAVLFDWFNTLAQYDPPRQELQAGICRDMGIHVSEDRLARGLLLADHYYVAENFRRPLKKRPPEEQMRVWAQMERTVLLEAGLSDVSDELALAIIQKAWTSFSDQRFMLFDDVLPALDRLKQHGLVLGIISNIDRDLLPACEELGLVPYLDVIITSSGVGSEKPEPPIFMAALQQAGADASSAMYVGDQHGTDVVGAQRVGMEGVLLDRYDLFSEISGCVRIRTLTDILDYV